MEIEEWLFEDSSISCKRLKNKHDHALFCAPEASSLTERKKKNEIDHVIACFVKLTVLKAKPELKHVNNKKKAHLESRLLRYTALAQLAKTVIRTAPRSNLWAHCQGDRVHDVMSAASTSTFYAVTNFN